MHAKDISGARFGRLSVVRKEGRGSRGEARWLCRCDCGKETVVLGSNLRTGNTTSCGCARKENPTTFKTRHGRTDSRVHRAWMSMRQRCENPRSTGYENYGGRGIRVCERWQVFENFLTDMGEPPAGHELDRIDVGGHYEPDNCRWASIKENARNKRDTVLVELNGRRQSLRAWSEETGIKFHTLYRRIVLRGEAPATALTRKPA